MNYKFILNIKNTKIQFLIIILLLIFENIKAQSDTLVNNKKLKAVIITESALYVGAMGGLYSLWYKDYAKSKFHFFNDNAEWLQMDKVGHTTTAYYLGKIGYESLKWTGLSDKNAILYGSTQGLLYLTTIEIMDGFSGGWGFSWGDMTANVIGSSLFISQQAIWKEQKATLKFSFHKTNHPQYRSSLLGKNLSEQILKDYNGQTYWLSLNAASFIHGNSIPKWLNIAIGYGAEGMIGAVDNSQLTIYNSQFKRYRQYYLSLDIDLSKIKTKSKFLNLLLQSIGFIKVPAPTLEFNTNKTLKFHYLYF